MLILVLFKHPIHKTIYFVEAIYQDCYSVFDGLGLGFYWQPTIFDFCLLKNLKTRI